VPKLRNLAFRFNPVKTSTSAISKQNKEADEAKLQDCERRT